MQEPSPSPHDGVPQPEGEPHEHQPVVQVEQLQQRIGALQLQLEELRHVHTDL